MVCPSFPPATGGVETAVAAQTAALAAMGHRVEVLTQGGGRLRADSAPQDGVSVSRHRSVTRSDRYPVAPGLFRAVRAAARDCDVIHAHAYHGAAALAVLGVGGDVPVVFTPHLHGDGHTSFARLMHVFHRPLGRRLFERADRVVCVSRAEAELVAARFPAVAARTEVVHNGVEPRVRPVAAGPGGRKLLLTVGRLEHYKRTELAVRALVGMVDWELAVVGDGPAARPLRQLAAALGVSGRTHFPGRVDDAELGRWMGRAWAFVSMSGREAFGLAILEAAAWGIPVVASDIPAHAEVATLAPGAIRLVPAGTAPASLAGIVGAVAKPMDAAVLQPWVADLAWTKVGTALDEVYGRVTGRPGRTSDDSDDRPHSGGTGRSRPERPAGAGIGG